MALMKLRGIFLSGLEGDMNDDWDQFKVNKEKFGIESTYSEELYTSKLDKNSEFYLERVASATKLAQEIQQTTTKNIHLLEERTGVILTQDTDEESLYSSVLRDEVPKIETSTEVQQTSTGSDATKESNVSDPGQATPEEEQQKKEDAKEQPKKLGLDPSAKSFTPRSVPPFAMPTGPVVMVGPTGGIYPMYMAPSLVPGGGFTPLRTVPGTYLPAQVYSGLVPPGQNSENDTEMPASPLPTTEPPPTSATKLSSKTFSASSPAFVPGSSSFGKFPK